MCGGKLSTFITFYGDFFFNGFFLGLCFLRSFTCFARPTTAALWATVEMRAPVHMGHGIVYT
jgi:hypothetical protein